MIFNKLLKSEGAKQVGNSVLAIVAGLIVGFIVLLVAAPDEAFRGFGFILKGGFSGGMEGVGDTFYYAAPIMLSGLSVAFAFKTGLFNIGATGQFTFGMYFALYSAKHFLGVIPDSLLWIVCLFAGILGGALWGAIPGLLKALCNVHEVITSIMTNYIAMYLVNMFIKNDILMFDAIRQRTTLVAPSAMVPTLGMENIFSGVSKSNINISIFIAIAVGVLLYFVLYKTKFGFELRSVGSNINASKYAGINEKKSIIYSMVIAGAIAGLAGAVFILAPRTYEPVNSLLPYGFTGIPVALLAASHPLGTIITALFVSHLDRGGFYIQLTSFKPEIIEIITGVILYFSAFSAIVGRNARKLINKILHMRKKTVKETNSKIVTEVPLQIEITEKTDTENDTTKEDK